MSNALSWSETNVDPLYRAKHRWRFSSVVFWQVAFVSVAAYISQTLIFDETNWYRIDLYDAFTWGLVVTQVFTLAIYVSRHRVQSVESSLKIFLSLGVLAAGLTIAAIAFLVIDAHRGDRDVLPLLLIAPGYWVAVFVFLVSMFLQLRLANICLQIFRPMLGRKRDLDSKSSSFDPLTESGADEKYSIADIFAFTGLAAVSISAYRLVLGMVTDYDALRFLAMFYAASITTFSVYGLNQLKLGRWLRLSVILVLGAALGYAEFYVAEQVRSPLVRFGVTGMVLCNYWIAVATTMQMWFVQRFLDYKTSRVVNS